MALAMTSYRMDDCEMENNNSSSSRGDTSRMSGSLASEATKYIMKTLCFARKSQTMPSKEEYSLLLCNGLGARKWQASLTLNAEEFRRAIISIYPRLGSIMGFSLWSIKKDKSFEKLPVKVNTPSRIRAYLGYQFTGCLIIMPLEEMTLVANASLNTNPDRHQLLTDTDDLDSGYRSQPSTRYRQIFQSQSRPAVTFSSHRQLCIICRRTSKQAGGPSTIFYDINKQRMTTEGSYSTTAEKLMDLLHIKLPRLDLIASQEICRRCYRQLSEIDFLETQLKRSKTEFINNFFQKLAMSRQKDNTNNNGGGDSCHLQCDSIPPENLCVPQRVYLTPAAYRDTFERNESSYVSRTLNVVPVRLSYNNEQMPGCLSMSTAEKSNSRTSNDDHRRYDSGAQNQYEGQHDAGQQDRRDRWFKKYNDNNQESSCNNDADTERDCQRDGDTRESNETTSTDENFEAAIVEAKRKGVARVEAFLDMMSFKGSSGENSSEDNKGSSGGSIRGGSNGNQLIGKDNQGMKTNSTSSPSNQTPSPLTFSSSSPEEAMNRVVARPRPWKKRHRHFDIDAAQAEAVPVRGSKRDFESTRPLNCHKMLRTTKDFSDKMDMSDSKIHIEKERSSPKLMHSDEENTGSSLASNSDSSLSSNNSLETTEAATKH